MMTTRHILIQLIGALLLAATPVAAQAPAAFTLTVTDGTSAPIAGATVLDAQGKFVGRTAGNGQLAFSCQAPCRVQVQADGFALRAIEMTGNASIVLQPATAFEQTTVTAYRTPLGELQSPATTRLLTETTLQTAADATMDGKMRQVPGVELFRRSSSLVANPSSQGISLRGLGSTSASRTLITLDDVPLNDPVGGWIHWEEQPDLAVRSVEVVRGGASDLYGSSAIGGVVNVELARPASNLAELESSYGGEGTYQESLRAQAKHGPWAAMLAGGTLGTDGYIQEAPWQRGPVDIASNVHAQNGLFLGEHESGPLRLLVRLSGFNEARANGTPFQTNGTRLWRYATGGDWQGSQGASATLRLYGSAEHYRQTFSSISNLPDFGDPECSYRCGETPTKLAQIADNELGAAAHWSQPLARGLLLVAGADAHDVRVWDDETALSASPTLTDTGVHQRDSAAYAEIMAEHGGWTLIASARMDWFQNYDVRQTVWNGGTWTPAPQLPQFDQRVFDPRMGVSRKIAQRWAVSASGFRAFRAPSPSELYRATQVGNELTKANGALKSERATGWETGLTMQRNWGMVRASYFLTQINRPISAVTVNPNSSPILLQRENLGQIESRGVSLDFELAPRSWLIADGGYQYAHATVTRGTADLGNWIPEVARNMATLNLRASRQRLGTLSLQSRLSGRQFDDDANVYLLHGYFRLDTYAEHDFGERITIFAAGENLLDRTIEVAKTPTTTLGMPRVARAGFTIRLHPAAQ
jgi:outer membrane receptor protein involved in Fe transport